MSSIISSKTWTTFLELYQDAVDFNAGFGLKIKDIVVFEGKGTKTDDYLIFGFADFRIFSEKLTFL